MIFFLVVKLAVTIIYTKLPNNLNCARQCKYYHWLVALIAELSVNGQNVALMCRARDLNYLLIDPTRHLKP